MSLNSVRTEPRVSSLRFTSPGTNITHLQTVDSVDATILVDNNSDILLPSKDRVLCPVLTWDWSKRSQLIAEHGYSLLFDVHRKGNHKTILYDAGLSPDTITRDLAILGIQLTDLDAIVLSHGRANHQGGLLGLVPGWRVSHLMSRAMPEVYIEGSVGTRIQFG